MDAPYQVLMQCLFLTQSLEIASQYVIVGSVVEDGARIAIWTCKHKGEGAHDQASLSNRYRCFVGRGLLATILPKHLIHKDQSRLFLVI